MSSSVVSSRRQSPSPAPVLPVSPLPELPYSRSSELKWRVCRAPRARVNASYVRAVPSNASMRPSPAASERLTTRAKPCRPYGSDVGGNSGTRCTPPERRAGTADRFVRWPVGLAIRLITRIALEDSMASLHLPAPSPIPPSRPGADPDSSSAAV